MLIKIRFIIIHDDMPCVSQNLPQAKHSLSSHILISSSIPIDHCVIVITTWSLLMCPQRYVLMLRFRCFLGIWYYLREVSQR